MLHSTVHMFQIMDVKDLYMCTLYLEKALVESGNQPCEALNNNELVAYTDKTQFVCPSAT